MRIITLIALTIFSMTAVADARFEGINRDVTVMTQILKGAFKADNQCRRCSIKTHYFADQGVVFFLSIPRVWNLEGRPVELDLSDFDARGLEDVPAMVEGILADVDLELHEVEAELDEIDLPAIHMGDVEGRRYITILTGIDRELRNALRDVRLERRDIEREISQRKISLINEDDEDVREDIQQEIASLSKQLADIGEKESRLNSRVEEARAQARAKREKARAEMRKAREKQQKIAENIILQAFCDYGSTLKNLPDEEHVSIVFEETPSVGDATVYVLKRNDIENCSKGADELKERAIAYQFRPI